jgi:uncharacterized protein (UPF0333 family)
MKSRFKSNDFFALLIAIALIAIGFVLLFIHQQSSASEAHTSNRTNGAVSTELIMGDNYDVYTNATREFLDHYFDKSGYTGELQAIISYKRLERADS